MPCTMYGLGSATNSVSSKLSEATLSAKCKTSVFFTCFENTVARRNIELECADWINMIYFLAISVTAGKVTDINLAKSCNIIVLRVTKINVNKDWYRLRLLMQFQFFKIFIIIFMDTIIMILLVIVIIIIVIDIYLLSRFCQKFSWVSLEVTGTTFILCTEFFLIQSILSYRKSYWSSNR